MNQKTQLFAIVLAIVMAMPATLTFLPDGNTDSGVTVGEVLETHFSESAQNADILIQADEPGKYDIIWGDYVFDPKFEVPPVHSRYSGVLWQEGTYGFFIVQFTRAVSSEEIEEIEAMGAIDQGEYVKNYGYVFGMDGGVARRLQYMDLVRAVTPIQPGMKIPQDLMFSAGDEFGKVSLEVMMYNRNPIGKEWDPITAEYDNGEPSLSWAGLAYDSFNLDGSLSSETTPAAIRDQIIKDRLYDVDPVVVERMEDDPLAYDYQRANYNVEHIISSVNVFTSNSKVMLQNYVDGEPILASNVIAVKTNPLDPGKTLRLKTREETLGYQYGALLSQRVQVGKGMYVDIQEGLKDRVRMTMPASLLPFLAQATDIAYISPMYDYHVDSDTAVYAIGTLGASSAYETYGFGGNNTFVAIADSGFRPTHNELDSSDAFGTATDPDLGGLPYDPPVEVDNHIDDYGKMWTYMYDEGSPGDEASGGMGHGTGVAAWAVGRDNGEDGLHNNNGNLHQATGVAPEAFLIGQEVSSISDDPGTTPWPGHGSAVQTALAYANSWGIPLAVHSNSWGYYGDSTYNTHSRQVDEAVLDYGVLLVFSAGNDDTTQLDGYNTAKNGLSIGSLTTWNTQADTDDKAAWGDTHGPTADGRIKPDLLFPGGDEYGTLTSGDCLDNEGGTAAQCTDCWSASATSDLAAAGDSEGGGYLWGTSFSAPGAAGAASVIYDYYRESYGISLLGDDLDGEPSPAMIKAIMINRATVMTAGDVGVGGIPNERQGWGSVNIGRDFIHYNELVPSIWVEDDIDIRAGTDDDVWETSEVFSTGVEPKGSEPFKVTIVWTDVAASSFTGYGDALVNDLDLYIIDPTGNSIYYGNNFTNSYANEYAYTGTPETDTYADTLNNVESVYISDASGGGTWQVVVRSHTPEGPVSDAVAGPFVNQPFSLVMSGIVTTLGVVRFQNLLNNYWYNGHSYDNFEVRLQDGSPEIDQYLVTVNSTRDPNGIQLTLVKTVWPNYVGYFDVDDTQDDPVGAILGAFQEDVFTVTHTDLDPLGHISTHEAGYDSLAPILANVSVTKLQYGTVYVHMEPHEAAYSVFKFQNLNTLNWTDRDTWTFQEPERYLYTDWWMGGLDTYTDYRIQIRATDQAENTRYWQWLQFRTPDQNFKILMVQDMRWEFQEPHNAGDLYAFNNLVSPRHLSEDIGYVGLKFDIWNMDDHNQGIGCIANFDPPRTAVVGGGEEVGCDAAGPTAAFMANYDTVIWNTGQDGWISEYTGYVGGKLKYFGVDGAPTLDSISATQEIELMDYLDGVNGVTPEGYTGGRLWLIGAGLPADLARLDPTAERFYVSGVYDGSHQPNREENRISTFLHDYLGARSNGLDFAQDFEDVPYDIVTHRWGFDSCQWTYSVGGGGCWDGSYKGDIRDWDDRRISLDARGGTYGRTQSFIDLGEQYYEPGVVDLAYIVDDLVPEKYTANGIAGVGSMARVDFEWQRDYPPSIGTTNGFDHFGWSGEGNWYADLDTGRRYAANNYSAILHYSDENLVQTEGYRTYLQAFTYNMLEMSADDAYYDGLNYFGHMWLGAAENHAGDRGRDFMLRVLHWLSPQPTVTGYITSSTVGRPIQDVIVNAYELWDSDDNGIPDTINHTIAVSGAKTDAEGYYELRTLSPGRHYCFKASHVDYKTEWYEENIHYSDLEWLNDCISPSGHEQYDNYNYTLDSGTIYGWVNDAEGPVYNPSWGSVLVALYRNVSSIREAEPWAVQKTDSSGFYYFTGLRGGNFDVVIEEYEWNGFPWNFLYNADEVNNLITYNLEDTAPINFFLIRKSGIISGYVCEDDPAICASPVLGEKVTAHGRGDHGIRQWAQTYSDSTGYYSFDTLLPDRYNLTVGVGGDMLWGEGARDPSNFTLLSVMWTNPIARSDYYSFMYIGGHVPLLQAEHVEDINFKLDLKPEVFLVNDNGWINNTIWPYEENFDTGTDYTAAHKVVLDSIPEYDYFAWNIEDWGYPNRTNGLGRFHDKYTEWPIMEEFNTVYWVTGSNIWDGGGGGGASASSNPDFQEVTTSTLTWMPGGEMELLTPYMWALSGNLIWEGDNSAEDFNRTGLALAPMWNVDDGYHENYIDILLMWYGEAGYPYTAAAGYDNSATSAVGEVGSKWGDGLTLSLSGENDADIITPMSSKLYSPPNWGSLQFRYNSATGGNASVGTTLQGHYMGAVTGLAGSLNRGVWNGFNLFQYSTADLADEQEMMRRLISAASSQIPPILLEASVSPDYGDKNNLYTWTVDYYDKNNDDPRAGGYVRVLVDGYRWFDMSRNRKLTGILADFDFTNGEQFIITNEDMGFLPWKDGGHSYQYFAADGNGTWPLKTSTTTFPGPIVGAPTLLEGYMDPVAPTTTVIGNEVEFQVVYDAPTNDPPQTISVLLERDSDHRLFGPYAMEDRGGSEIYNDDDYSNGEMFSLTLTTEIEPGEFHHSYFAASAQPRNMAAVAGDVTIMDQPGPFMVPSTGVLDHLTISPDPKYTYSGFDEMFVAIGHNDDGGENTSYSTDFNDCPTCWQPSWTVTGGIGATTSVDAGDDRSVFLLNSETDGFGTIEVEDTTTSMSAYADVFVTPAWHLHDEDTYQPSSGKQDLGMAKANNGIFYPAIKNTLRMDDTGTDYFIGSWVKGGFTSTETLNGEWDFSLDGYPSTLSGGEYYLYAKLIVEEQAGGETSVYTTLDDDESIGEEVARKAYQWSHDYTGSVTVDANDYLRFEFWVHCVESSRVDLIDIDIPEEEGASAIHQVADGNDYSGTKLMGTVSSPGNTQTRGDGVATFLEGTDSSGIGYTQWPADEFAMRAKVFDTIYGALRIYEEVDFDIDNDGIIEGGMQVYVDQNDNNNGNFVMGIYTMSAIGRPQTKLFNTEEVSLAAGIDLIASADWLQGAQTNLPVGQYHSAIRADFTAVWYSSAFTVQYYWIEAIERPFLTYFTDEGYNAILPAEVSPPTWDRYNIPHWSGVFARVYSDGPLYEMNIENRFTDVPTAMQYHMDIEYDAMYSGEDYFLWAWDFNNTVWDLLGDIIPIQSSGILKTPLDVDHRNSAGEIVVRIEGFNDQADCVQSNFTVDYWGINSLRDQVVAPQFSLFYDEAPHVYQGADSYIVPPEQEYPMDRIELDPWPVATVLDGSVYRMTANAYNTNFQTNTAWLPLWSVTPLDGNGYFEDENDGSTFTATEVGNVNVKVECDPSTPCGGLYNETLVVIMPALYLHIDHNEDANLDLIRGVPGEQAGVQNSDTARFDTAGDFKVADDWVSTPYIADAQIDGTWMFLIYGKVDDISSIASDAYLYAKVYDHTTSSLLFTTGLDDNDVTNDALWTYYKWEFDVTGGLSIPMGDALRVEFWVNVVTGGHEDAKSDTETVNTLEGTAFGWFNSSGGGDCVVSDLTASDSDYCTLVEADLAAPLWMDTAPDGTLLNVDNQAMLGESDNLLRWDTNGDGFPDTYDICWTALCLSTESDAMNYTVYNGTNNTDYGYGVAAWDGFSLANLETNGSEPILNVDNPLGNQLQVNVSYSHNVSYTGNDWVEWRCPDCTPAYPDWQQGVQLVTTGSGEFFFDTISFLLPIDIDTTEDLGLLQLKFDLTDNPTGNATNLPWTIPKVMLNNINISVLTDPELFHADTEMEILDVDPTLEDYSIYISYVGDANEGLGVIIKDALWGQWVGVCSIHSTGPSLESCMIDPEFIGISGEVGVRLRSTNNYNDNLDKDEWMIDYVYVEASTPEKFGPYLSIGYDNVNTNSGVVPHEVWPGDTVNINLKPGWNFITIPIVPTATTLEGVMNGLIDANPNTWQVIFYDGVSSTWSYHDDAKSSQYHDTFVLDETISFYLYVESISGTPSLKVSGEFPSASTAIWLEPGWNMVGYPCTVETNTAANAFGGLWSNLDVYAGDAFGGDPNKGFKAQTTLLQSDDVMNLKQGYWVYNHGAGTNWDAPWADA